MYNQHMDKCTCAAEGKKIQASDIGFEWIHTVRPDGLKEVRSERIHQPCGKQIDEKAVEIS